jgi:hypothetical protein
VSQSASCAAYNYAEALDLGISHFVLPSCLSRHVQIVHEGILSMEQTMASHDRVDETLVVLLRQKPAKLPVRRNRSILLGERAAS